MKIIDKLLLSNLSVTFLILLTGGFILYFTIEDITSQSIKNEMQDSVAITFRSIESSFSIVIRNHLRSHLKKLDNRFHSYHQQVQNRRMSKKHALRILQSHITNKKIFKIGKSGYFAAFDSQGRSVLHPYLPKGHDLTHHGFIREALKKKQGYTEYMWRNRGKKEYRAKAAIFREFKPWDLILWASAYKEEFQNLIRVNDFRSMISDINIGKSGYFFILDDQGNILLHPTILDKKKIRFIGHDKISRLPRILNSQLSGNFTYTPITVPNEPSNRVAIYYKYLPDLDWYLIANIRLQDIYEPVYRLRFLIVLIIISTMVILGLALYLSSTVVTRPIDNLLSAIRNITKGDLEVRAKEDSKDEFGELGRRFNKMTEFLQQNLNQANQQKQEVIAHNEKLKSVIHERSSRLMEDIEIHSERKQGTPSQIESHFIDELLYPKNEKKSQELSLPPSWQKFQNSDISFLFETIPLDQYSYAIYTAQIHGPYRPYPILHNLVHKIVHRYAHWNRRPDQVCQIINNELAQMLQDTRNSVTLYYSVININSGVFQFTNAGHAPAYLMRSNKVDAVSMDTEGFIMGLLPHYQFKERAVHLRERDRLLFFTRDIFGDYQISPKNLRESISNFRRSYKDSTPEKFLLSLASELANKWDIPIQELKKSLHILCFSSNYESYRKSTLPIFSLEKDPHTVKSPSEAGLEWRDMWDWHWDRELTKRIRAQIQGNQSKQTIKLLQKMRIAHPDNFFIINQLVSLSYDQKYFNTIHKVLQESQK